MSQTRDQLQALAYQLADMESDTGFMPNAEVQGYINAGVRRFVRMISQWGGEAWFRSPVSVNTTADVATIAWSAIVASTSIEPEIYGITATIGDNEVTLEPIDFGRRDRFEDVNGWDDLSPIYYSLEQSGIRFFPTPDAAYALTIWITTEQPATLTAGSSTIEAHGFEEWIAYHAAIQMLTKEKSETADVRAERDKIEREAFDYFISGRDHGYPERVRDVRGARRDDMRRRWT